jgi:sugar-specific transcriptional regulator TrmB
VVAALRKHGPATVPELAEATKVKPGVLYALTRVLVDKGVLSTEKTNGRRAFALAEYTTDAGARDQLAG